MALDRKGYSSRRARRTSERMQDATLGTHVVRQRGSHARPSAQQGGSSYSSARRSNRTSSDRVTTVMPTTSTLEDSSAYRQRVSRSRYVDVRVGRTRRKRVLVVVVILVVLLAIAGGVGLFTYMRTVGSNVALKDSDATKMLVTPKSGTPYYALISAEMGAVAVPLENEGPDVLLLARVDEANGAISLINIPPNLQVTFTDGKHHRISEAALSGDAALIEAVSKFAAVDIGHFVKVEKGGIEGIVDALGGIEVTFDQEIDDPRASDVYFAPGTYTLTGPQAVGYLRTSNLRMGGQDRAANQGNFAALIMEKLFATGGALNFAAKLDAIGPYLQTDYSGDYLMNLADKFSKLKAANVTSQLVPGYETVTTGAANEEASYYIAVTGGMKQLIAAVELGQVLVDKDKVDTSGVVPGSFTIEVQNGANIVGAAAITHDLLVGRGFNVVEVGNAEQPVYTETLVVYKSDEGRVWAHAVAEALGVGRAVDGRAYYEFETDILLILGSDYLPIA